MSGFKRGLALIACAGLVACGSGEPIRIGFIGGLSDRNSDVGQSGEHGVQLAVERINRAGGINGRLVELVSRDDAQDSVVAARSAGELAAAGVEAVIGPFTSGMAAAILPVTAKAGILNISPTLTAMDYYGKDDNLVRINRTTRDNATDYARVMFARGQRRVAVAYDTRNLKFTESWLAEFRQAYAAAGGRLTGEVPYHSQPDADFAGVVRAMLKDSPDGLFFISGAIDVARLAKEARAQAPGLPIGASEWAATEQLLDLGGRMVDGLLIVLNFDGDDESPRFVEFREAYFRRFQRNPGYSSISAYDAATVLFEALRRRRGDEPVKAAVLKYGPYQGLQQQIAFDANGDTQRKVFFNEIRDGRFRPLAVDPR